MINITPKLPVEIGDIVERIVESFSPERIILFGSYASGDVTPDSDLDLLVIMEPEFCTEPGLQRKKNRNEIEKS